MEVEVTILKDIPKDKIRKFEDLVIYEMARETLALTSGNFPRLTGDLERSSYAMGVVNLGNMTYGLGAGVDYAKYVWKMSDKTNWTNPNTIPQWYYWVFAARKDNIINQAVTGAKKVL